MERILQFADSKTTGERWIFFSENVRKWVNNAAFSNIHNLFSERVNTTFFAVNDYLDFSVMKAVLCIVNGSVP